MHKFDRIVLWCEFPQWVDWKKMDKLLEEAMHKPEIYVACTSHQNYKWWAREIKTQCKNINEVNAWPVLAKNEGYWFSGFTNKKSIDSLLEYKGTKMKIDLEPPLPKYRYSNWNLARYLLSLISKKGENRKYLAQTIAEAEKSNDVLINEFPIPKFILKRWGCYYPTKNKNVMCYTSLLKHKTLLRWWNFMMAKRRRATMCSLGLIHTGIFGNEPHYNNVKELTTDMEYALRKDFRNVAVYSIDSIARRSDAISWLKTLKSFS